MTESENKTTAPHPFDWVVHHPNSRDFPLSAWRYSLYSELRGFHRALYPTFEQAEIAAVDLNNLEQWHTRYTPEIMAGLTMP